MHKFFAGMKFNKEYFLQLWQRIHVQKWGKYVLVLAVFAVVYLFIGDQSMVHFWHRHREIRRLEEQRDHYRASSEEAQRRLQNLHRRDSLERFAREHYFMHQPGEDIYLVEEN